VVGVNKLDVSVKERGDTAKRGDREGAPAWGGLESANNPGKKNGGGRTEGKKSMSSGKVLGRPHYARV